MPATSRSRAAATADQAGKGDQASQVGQGPPRRPRGRPPRTEDQRADHRRRLIAAAMDAVRLYGPEVSLDQMADLAEVSKPVLYAEFGDKTGIVDAIAVELAATVERRVIERVGRAGGLDVELTLSTIIDALIDLIDAEPHLYSYIVRSLRMRDRGLLDNALVRVIHDRAALIIGEMAAELRPDELHILADGVFSFLLGVVESWVATRKPEKERLVATMTAVIRAGLDEAVARRADLV